MAAEKWKTLESWIDDAMRDADKEGRLSAIQLTVRLGMADKELHTSRFEASTDFRAHDLAQMFHGKAMGYAQGVDGRQQFCLHAFYGGRAEPQAVHPFKVNPPADPNGGYATEEATPQGKAMQSMRHGEDMHAALKANLQIIFNRQNQMDAMANMREHAAHDTISMLMRANQQLIAQSLDAVDIVTKMKLREAELDHKRAMELSEFQRATGERGKLIQMVPALANQLAGKEIFPQSTADTAIVEGIGEYLLDNPQLLAVLQGSLPPEKVTPLIGRIEMIQKKREELAKQMAALPRGNAESELGGTELATTNGGGNEPH